MKQVNKYVVFKNTYEPETILYFFQSREDAMSFKVKEEEAEELRTMKGLSVRGESFTGTGWTVASVDPPVPRWFRKMWLWLESKMRCYE